MSPALEAQQLTVRYRRGGEAVLHELDVHCVPGEVTVLTGPSGSGKSTLLYTLALMLRAESGSVLWGDVDAGRLPDTERARLRAGRSGFVFQDAMLDPSRSIVDNVCESGLFAGMPAAEARQRAVELLERFGVGHRVDHRPGEISGGQAQRVGLCRALLTAPEVVFGDEPTGNLDAASAQVVWRALADHARAGATVVIATHDRELAARADRRVVLE